MKVVVFPQEVAVKIVFRKFASRQFPFRKFVFIKVNKESLFLFTSPNFSEIEMCRTTFTKNEKKIGTKLSNFKCISFCQEIFNKDFRINHYK